MKLQPITKINLANKQIFLRADLNVPLKDGIITSDYRLKAIIPTLDYILQNQGRIILATHLGHPDVHTKTNYFDAKLSTQQLIPWFKEHGYSVTFEPDLYAAQKKSHENPLHAPHILLLENLRFYPGETEHDLAFVELLASLADVYINDAFGLIHRTDSSVTLLPQKFSPENRGIGLLIVKEIDELSTLKDSPKQPYLMVLGGKKITTKMGLLENLLTIPQAQRPQRILFGGAIANTFLKAQGFEVGKSLIDKEALTSAQNFLTEAKEAGITVMLPSDLIIMMPDNTIISCPSNAIPVTGTCVDIGPETIDRYCKEIHKASAIFANGTMGIYEQEGACTGTKSIFQTIAENNGCTIIGGGDAVSAAHHFKLENQFTFVSTGGGATLAFLSSSNVEHDLPALGSLRIL